MLHSTVFFDRYLITWPYYDIGSLNTTATLLLRMRMRFKIDKNYDNYPDNDQVVE